MTVQSRPSAPDAAEARRRFRIRTAGTAHHIQDVLTAARALCIKLEPFELTFGEAEVRREAIAMRPWPADPVSKLRDTLRSAIGSVLRTVPEAPEHACGFEPHVSVAYSNHEVPSEPYVDAVADLGPPTAAIRVLSAKLIVLDRDERVYRWMTYGYVPLGASHPMRRDIE